MFTINYKDYFIFAYCDKDAVKVSRLGSFKSVLAAKQAITKHINSKANK